MTKYAFYTKCRDRPKEELKLLESASVALKRDHVFDIYIGQYERDGWLIIDDDFTRPETRPNGASYMKSRKDEGYTVIEITVDFIGILV